MKVQIEVKLSGEDAFSLHDLTLRHVDCWHETMQQRRNPATEDWTLRCGCGLTLLLASNGDAKNSIEHVAIDAVSRELKQGTFWAGPEAEVSIVRVP